MSKVTALLLTLVLSFPACGMARKTENSVQALQYQDQTFCTVFSINEAEGLWASAAHCAESAITKESTILGKPAYVIFMGYPSADIAVFQSEARVPAMKLSEASPKVGDDVVIVGYPYGITRTRTKGTVGARQVAFIHPTTAYAMLSDILDITVAGGNSGSPVLNKDGEVVGLLWGAFGESSHAISVSYEGTIRALLPFVE